MSLPISLVGTGSYLPEKIVPNSYFTNDGPTQRGMFKGSLTRHHVEDMSAAEMIERATRSLFERLGRDPKTGIDLILTNTTVLDAGFTGCGAVVKHRLGSNASFVLDVQNTGCVSFVYMMQIAQSMMATMNLKTALICNVQNAGGRVFSHPKNRLRAQSAVPGDGCGVGLIEVGDRSPVLAIKSHCYGDYAEDMRLKSDDGKRWWEPRETPLHIDFTQDKVAKIVGRGNQLVPNVVRETCAEAGIKVGDIGTLVTNQPSPIFLRNWREALLLPKERHVDSFENHGNLFGAAIPICIEKAEASGQLEDDSYLVLGGFSHAGDYAAAAVIHWNATA
jgi:3-oxoacyl-[acyl-carrier-protein] synthase-3